MCCYFGMVARGRVGSIIAGLGFMLPGFFIMLSASWAYSLYGLSNPRINASFLAMQAVAVSMVFRAVHKIGEHACINATTQTLDQWLLVITGLAAIETVLEVNFFIVLAHCGILYFLIQQRWYITAAIFAGLSLALYIFLALDTDLFQGTNGTNGDSGSSDHSAIVLWLASNSLPSLFIMGFLGSLITVT